MSNHRFKNWQVILVIAGSWFGALISASAQVGHPLQRARQATQWAGDVSATNAHPEYPRPTMVRLDWLNLNGPWDYGVTSLTETNAGTFNDQILVPFPVESVLSGVQHHFVTEMQRLWYRREFTIPAGWRGQNILLHFEGSDWETRVWVNGRELGMHQGGYDRFSFDITDALKSGSEQELVVSVFNPAETGLQPRGKQMFHPRPPFFGANSGIWQTVWLEPVPQTFVESLKQVPDIDADVLRVTVFGGGETNDATVEALAFDGEKEVGRAKGHLGEEFSVAIPNAKFWSPDKPFLYGLKLNLLRQGKEVDSVSSYFGMRKISVAKDKDGFPRLMLNNKALFQLGPLDQGYWPDGIYTAPTDEALRYDVETMKRLGFNMCRKHVKVEPERWYYWCDKLGLLVWQDMPNGDHAATDQQREIQRRPESARQFEQELKQMILGRGNHPCIVMWIPFNQGWGQYDTVRITALVKQLDPSRLVAGVSGWYDKGGGDVRSQHAYPTPAKFEHDGIRASVEGECGGFGLVVAGHVWSNLTYWNTIFYKTPEELTGAYSNLLATLKSFEDKNGLAGAVITQWTDIDGERNGFVTYDRAIIKMPVEMVRKIDEELINDQLKSSAGGNRAGSSSTKQE